MSKGTPGFPGIALLAAATGVAAIGHVVLFGAVLPAAACVTAIVVGLWAVQSVNKR